MSVRMVVLGIDPGTASTGYGVVEGTGSRLRALDGGVITESGSHDELVAAGRTYAKMYRLQAARFAK